MNYLEYIPKFEIPSNPLTYYFPIEHPRAEEAKLKGMTVELLLELERKNQQSPGVVIEDKRDAYQNMRASVKNNSRELQRLKEGEAKAKENTARAVNLLLAPTLASNYIGAATGAMDIGTGEAKNTVAGLLWNDTRLVLDIAIPGIIGLGAGLAKLAIGRRVAQNAFENRVAREIAEKSAAKTSAGHTIVLNQTSPFKSIQISPEDLASRIGNLTKDGNLAVMGHGTGRSMPQKELFFKNGLRVKYGDLNNTAIPLGKNSFESLRNWPHLNSEEVVLVGFNPEKSKYGSTGWVHLDAFPENSFTHKVIEGKDILDPGIDAFVPNNKILYTSPERIIGVYNTKNGTLTFNPRNKQFTSFYESPELHKTSLAFFERPSKLTEAERLGLPKGTKIYSPEENLAFRQQINDFANKYGYEPIGNEVTDPEVLERYARSLIKRHNTYFRGVNGYTSEAEAKLWATHAPGGGAGELYISPYKNVASMYGDPVEIMRPFKLGKDRTKWFTEGDFKIATAGGLRDMQNFRNVKGIVDPWNTNEDIPIRFIPNELTGRNQQFIPQRITYAPKYGSRDWGVAYEDIIGSKNRPTAQFTPNVQFKSGGTLNYLNYIK